MGTPIFTVTVASDTLPKLQADLYRIARELGGSDASTEAPQQGDMPGTMSEAAEAAGEPEPQPNGAAPPPPQAGPSSEGMSVEALTSMVNKKETASTALADGSRVKANEYVRIGDEKWYVDKTFRGTLIVTNEAGRSEAVSTEHCYPVTDAGPAVADEGHPASEPEKPRPGTAGAFAQIEKPTASQIDDARSRAASLCISSKASPDQVFAKLKEAGSASGKFDDLNMEGFNAMLTWISGLEKPAEDSAPSTGFGF